MSLLKQNPIVQTIKHLLKTRISEKDKENNQFIPFLCPIDEIVLLNNPSMGVESRLGADLNRPCGSNKNEERNTVTQKVSDSKINLNP